MLTRTGRLPAYLTTNGYSYCFRMRVPHDLSKPIGRKVLKFSLGTDIFLAARTKALIWANRYRKLFKWIRNQVRMGKLADKQIQEIAVDHLQRWKDSFEAVRPSLGDDVDPFLAHLALKKQIETFEADKAMIRADLETGNYRDVVSELPEILETHGINFEDVDQDDPSFAKLCAAMLRAKERAIGLYRDRLSSGYGTKRRP